MDHLNLLQISCPADGLIYLNGTLAGELLAGDLSLCIPRGRFCLSFTPLEQKDDKIYLPFARILDLSEEEPVIVRDDGLLRVYLMGEICCVKILPPFSSLPCLPYIVAAHSFSYNGVSFRAQVYFDRVLCFSLEENGRITFACPLPFAADAGRIFTARVGDLFCAFAELETGSEKMLACIAVQQKKLLFCEPCLSHRLAQGAFDVISPAGGCGYAVRKRYSGDFSHPACALTRQEGEEADIARAFARAMQYGDAEAALSFLSPSLSRELSFEDLREFFSGASPAPEEFARPGELAFCEALSPHIFCVHRFSLQMQGGKIDNIEER